MHKNAKMVNRNERVKQSTVREDSVLDYKTYVPIEQVVKKLNIWKSQKATILYLSSHETKKAVDDDIFVLKKYFFPEGEVFYRKNNKNYAQVAEEIMPDILIEDDCESIGGKKKMTYTYIKPELKQKIKSISVKEFGGIEHLPDNLEELKKL
ncbi:MAG: hypothetical protein B6I23_00545 [Rickettsiaceae bacterium 4572_127]|nr:MAG: hypothetical protein B6I23_00545 [Rickettsiaceae bacterium 4572_127]